MRGNHEAWSQGFPRWANDDGSGPPARIDLPGRTTATTDRLSSTTGGAIVAAVAVWARTDGSAADAVTSVVDGVPAGTGRVADLHGVTTAVTTGTDGGEILVDAGHRVLLWLWPRSGAKAPPESVRVHFVVLNYVATLTCGRVHCLYLIIRLFASIKLASLTPTHHTPYNRKC